MKNYASSMATLQTLKVKPSDLPGFGTSFDKPSATWQALKDEGGNVDGFLRQTLYSANSYMNFGTIVQNDVVNLSRIFRNGYESSAHLMESENWATPRDKANPGTNHNTISVDHPCIVVDKDKKLVRGRSDDITLLPDEWQRQDMGVKLSFTNKKTFEGLIPEVYWVAQFLDQGKVDLCYKWRDIDKSARRVDFNFEIQGRFLRPDGSDVLIAARDFKSRWLDSTSTPVGPRGVIGPPIPVSILGAQTYAWLVDGVGVFWLSDHSTALGPEIAWQTQFYGPTSNTAMGHRKDIFGEDVADGSFGRQLALSGLIAKLKVLFPDRNTGELPDQGGEFSAYFSEGFAGNVAQPLTKAIYNLYAHVNQLMLASDIQAVVSGGRSQCFKSLVDYRASDLLGLATNTIFMGDDDRSKQIVDELSKPATALVANCSSKDLKDVFLKDAIDGLRKAKTPQS